MKGEKKRKYRKYNLLYLLMQIILIIKALFNLFLEKYKEIFSYSCECRKNNKGDVLCVKIKYNIESYPTFLFILFDFQFSELNLYKDKIYKLVDNILAFNIRLE